MTRTDAALATARDVLKEQVCECGHLDSDHTGSLSTLWTSRECHAIDRRCGCREYRPVAFRVERAK